MPSLELVISEFGLTLDMLIGLSGPRLLHEPGRRDMRREPLPVRVIIDTGASISCIASDLVEILDSARLAKRPS